MPVPRKKSSSRGARGAGTMVAVAIAEHSRRLGAAAGGPGANRTGEVHDTRVAARRLRSILATFGPLLDWQAARQLRRELRAVAHALSAVREADVRRDLVLGVSAAERLPMQDVARLRTLLDRSRTSARAALRRERARPEWAARLQALARGLAPAALQIRPDASLAEVLKLANRPWRKAGRLVVRLPGNADDLHRLRLCLKHCRYALEVVASVRSDEAERALEGLRRAQDCLGEHRDAVQAVEWARANEPVLGRVLAKAIVRPLKRQDRALRRQAVLRASEAVTLHDAWRDATRSIRKDSGSRRDRG